MNKTRRTQIAEAQRLVEQATALLEDAKAALENAREEEQEYLDNMPQSFQDGDKGEVARAAIEALDTVIDAIEGLDDVSSALDEAQS